ncbi:MAG: DUF5702 domain-containing protein [Lachnospiraceae bacterium]|nr:DUF5702 domain-containing protein [Lachnospiraceae bacterium]
MTALLFRRKENGEITVFLSMVLASFLGLAVVLIQSARLQLIRMNIEGVMDAGLHSCFGEYDRKLFKRYDLLFIDSSYRGESEAGIDSVMGHLCRYMTANTDYSDTSATGEWYCETVGNAEAAGYILASDEGGTVLKSQASDYMVRYGEYKYTDRINANRQVLSDTSGDFMGEWDALIDAVNAYGFPLMNPGEEVRRMVLDEDEFINGSTLNSMRTGDIPSGRSLKHGKGGKKTDKRYCSDEAFVEYLMQKCGCYTENDDEQQLICEIEYLLYGNDNDRDNMLKIIKRLTELREWDNIRCIRSDGGKLQAAWNMAYDTVEYNMPVYMEVPDAALVKLVCDSIVYAWAYAESAADVSRLLNGGNCPVVKSGPDIKLSLEKLLNFRSCLYGSGGAGISYKDYAGIFLTEIPDETRRSRLMDIIEGNFRCYYNDNFRIDGCVEYLEAEVEMTSSYGFSHVIKRDLIYE